MERMHIDLPGRFAFTTDLEVRIADVNYGRHVGNDTILSFLHEARLRFLAQAGFSEWDAGGCGLIMTDATVAYRAQAVHGDRLRVAVAAADAGKASFALVYRVTRAGDDREIARARTGMAFFDYSRNRPVRMPDAFRLAFFPAAPA